MKKEPADFEKADFSKYNIEELLLSSVSDTNYLVFRASNSETPKKFSVAGFPSRPMTTKSLIQESPAPGLAQSEISPHATVLVRKVFGRIRMDFATGENFEL